MRTNGKRRDDWLYSISSTTSTIVPLVHSNWESKIQTLTPSLSLYPLQPDLVSSHRRFVSKCEVTELSNNLSGRDDPLMLFLFTDYMEICKIKKHRFNSAKSPTTTFGTTGLNTARVSHQKSYKHIKLLPLSSIAVVYDVQDSPRAFALPHKDKMYSFSICDDIEKIIYLKSLCKQLAENACRADAVSPESWVDRSNDVFYTIHFRNNFCAVMNRMSLVLTSVISMWVHWRRLSIMQERDWRWALEQ